MARQETETSGLNREAVIQAALEMLDTVGVDGLSMRALADRLGVKAASLYWHLRDKDQLLELVAEAVLDRVVVPVSPGSWRSQVAEACDDLAAFLVDHRAAASVVLASLPVVQRSRLTRDLARVLAAAGLEAAESAAFTLVVEAAASAFSDPLRDGAEAGWPGHDPGNQLGLMACDGPRRATRRGRPRDLGRWGRSGIGGGSSGQSCARQESPWRRSRRR